MTIKRNAAGHFLPGSGGRMSGARNKLQGSFLKALSEDFEREGAGVINIVRVEKPAEYLRLIAAVLPKELMITDDVLNDMTEEELSAVLLAVRQRLAAAPQEDPESAGMPH